MIEPLSPPAAEEVARTVQRFLDQNQPTGFRLDVYGEGIKADADWWYVPVFPTPTSVRSHEYAHALAGVEERIQDDTKMNVLLVPTIIDE